MLLSGIIEHLPRGHFNVIVCPIDSPGKRLGPSLADAADEVVQLPQNLWEARRILGDLK